MLMIRIQRFDRNGIFVTKWGSYGFNNGQFIGPEGVAVDSSDNVYVWHILLIVVFKNLTVTGTLLQNWDLETIRGPWKRGCRFFR